MPHASTVFSQCKGIVDGLKAAIIGELGASDAASVAVSGWVTRLERLILLERVGVTGYPEQVHDLELDLGFLANRLDQGGRSALALKCWDAQERVLVEFLTETAGLHVPSAFPGTAFLDHALARLKLSETLEAIAKLLEELWRLDEAANTLEHAVHTMTTLPGSPDEYEMQKLAHWLVRAAKLRVEVGQIQHAVSLLDQGSAYLYRSQDGEGREFPAAYIAYARYHANLTGQMVSPGRAIEIINEACRRVEPFVDEFDGCDLQDFLDMITVDLPVLLVRVDASDDGTCFVRASSLLESAARNGAGLSGEDAERLRKCVHVRAASCAIGRDDQGFAQALLEEVEASAIAALANIGTKPFADTFGVFLKLIPKARQLCDLRRDRLALRALRSCARQLSVTAHGAHGSFDLIVSFRSTVVREICLVAQKLGSLEVAASEVDQFRDELRPVLGSVSRSSRKKFVDLNIQSAAILMMLSRANEALARLEEGFETMWDLSQEGKPAATDTTNFVSKPNSENDQESRSANIGAEDRITRLARARHAILWAHSRYEEAHTCRSEVIAALDGLARRGMLSDVRTLERLKALSAYA